MEGGVVMELGWEVVMDVMMDVGLVVGENKEVEPGILR
jgi:hypothetical protein